jgi:RNA polymerase-associated protein RTF1
VFLFLLQITTDKALKLQFGKNERTFLMKLVSDNKASENDVFLYKTEVKNQRQQVLSMKEANKIRRKQDELVGNYTYTTEDIETNLRNRKKKNQSAANLGSEQTRAAIAVQAGKAALVDAKLLAKSGDGDSAGVDAAKKALQERLEDERLVMERVKDRNDRLTLRGADKKWALVNKRALEMNQKLDRGALRDLVQEKKDSESKPKFNPYARRKVKPKILWEVGQKDDEEKAELKKAEAKKAAESREKEHDGTPSLVQEQQEKAAAQNQSHQFAIDEEIMAQSSFTNGITGLSAKKPVRKRVRKGLSLNDYLERKGAGTL